MYTSLLTTSLAVVSILLLTCVEIAQPPTSLKPKVFVIGLSKTGTTSLGDALHLMGYKRLGWKDIRSRQLVHSYIHQDLAGIVEQTQYYDAFEDLPWPHLYREMASLYADARFILSLRRDDQIWLRSMQRHVMRGRWKPYAHFYGADMFPGNEETILHAYRNHTEAVRSFFSDQPHRYLELVIDDGDANWPALCHFVDCPSTAVLALPFPRSNTAGHWHSRLGVVDGMHWLWGWSVTRIEEYGTYLVFEVRQPSMRALLVLAWRVVDLVEQACSEMYYRITSGKTDGFGAQLSV